MPQTPRHAQRRCEQSAAGCARPEAFRLQSCRGVVSSSRRRSLCRCSPDCEFTGMMAQPLNGPSLRSRDSNDYSAAVQRCLSAERLVRGMNACPPIWGETAWEPVPRRSGPHRGRLRSRCYGLAADWLAGVRGAVRPKNASNWRFWRPRWDSNPHWTGFESVPRVCREVTTGVAGCRNNSFELRISGYNVDDWDCCVTAEIGTFLLLLRYLLVRAGSDGGDRVASRRVGKDRRTCVLW